VPRYRLIDDEGHDLGAFHTAAPTWVPGDKIHRGPDASFVVVNLTPALDGDDVDGYLVVKAAH
jgi:hypothetical protein